MSFSEKNWLIITSGFAPVYTKADFNSPCVTDAVYGESCQVLDQENTWFNVKCEDGYTGWIKSFYGSISAEKNKPTHVVAFPDKNGQFKSYCPFGSKVKENLPGSIQITDRLGLDQIIPVAKNLLGIPYRWGGKTSMGFDCSGLVQSVLNVCGFHFPRDSYQQRNFLKDYKINLNETKPGDLHFFGKDGKVTHVGFSTGGAGLLHSQGSIKKESLDLHAADLNKKLLDIYLSSYSIQRKFHP